MNKNSIDYLRSSVDYWRNEAKKNKEIIKRQNATIKWYQSYLHYHHIEILFRCWQGKIRRFTDRIKSIL